MFGELKTTGLKVRVFAQVAGEDFKLETEVNQWLEENPDLDLRGVNVTGAGHTVVITIWYYD